MTVRPADDCSSEPPATSRAIVLAAALPPRAAPSLLRRFALELGLVPIVALALSASACGSDSGGPASSEPEVDGGVLPDGQTPVDKVCSADGWCWDVPFPQGNGLAAVWASSADNAWFVGDRGTILHYADGHWQASVSPTTRDLKGIWGSGPKDVWAVGAYANLLHYDGTAWSLENGTAHDPEPLDGGAEGGEGGVDAADAGHDSGDADAGEAGPPGLPDNRDLLAIHGYADDDIWVVGAAGTIAHYDGVVWAAEEGVTTAALRTVWAGSAKTVFAAGDNVIYQYDGDAWAKVDPGVSRAWYSIRGSGLDDIWIVGASSAVAHFDGTKWTADTLPGGTANTVVADVPDSAWAFGDQGAAWRWDGETWTSVSTGTKERLLGSGRYGAGKFFVAGTNGAMMKWENGARTTLVQSFEANFLGLAGNGSDDLWVVGDTVLHGNTEQWTESSPPVNRSLFGIWSGDKDSVWAVGTAGTILGRSLIGWVVAQSPTEEWLRGVWGAASGSGWIVGDKGTILGLLNGTTWAAVPSGTTADLYAVWGPSPAEAWAVGDKGTIIHWDKGQWQASSVEIGDAGTPFRATLHGVWGTASSNVWAVGSLGAILHYDGSSWRVAASGGDETLNAVWGRSATEVWAVGTSGTVLRYDGTSWAPSDCGAGVDLRAVWGSDDGYTWIVGDHGAILRRSIR